MKEAFLRFTTVLYSGRSVLNVSVLFSMECSGTRYFYFFKTLRRLDTALNFACSITRVSTHEHEH